MTEDFLHFIWKFRLFDSVSLFTSTGENIQIVHSGVHNFNGGPDFLNARLIIGGQMWAGHVEIHIKASDWNRHGHQFDDHYKNVILHAVFEDDMEIYLKEKGDLPVLRFSDYISKSQLDVYERWMSSKKWIPCQERAADVDEFHWRGWKERLVIEKLGSKYHDIISVLKECQDNWHEVFYRRLCRNFGFKVNGQAMEMLAASLPFQLLQRYRANPLAINALLFGQAGLLNKIDIQGYPGELKKEYLHLKRKHRLHSMNPVVWNFGRMRPSNFPTIRIAQLAALICKYDQLFSTFIEWEEPSGIPQFFRVEAHPYWATHYVFPKAKGKGLFESDVRDTPVETGMESKRPNMETTKSTKIGLDACLNLSINTVASMVFSYGQYRKDEKSVDKSIKLLQICKTEQNQVTRNWSKWGIDCEDAFDSQAIIWLFDQYCSHKKCLNCRIGARLLNKQLN